MLLALVCCGGEGGGRERGRGGDQLCVRQQKQGQPGEGVDVLHCVVEHGRDLNACSGGEGRGKGGGGRLDRYEVQIALCLQPRRPPPHVHAAHRGGHAVHEVALPCVLERVRLKRRVSSSETAFYRPSLPLPHSPTHPSCTHTINIGAGMASSSSSSSSGTRSSLVLSFVAGAASASSLLYLFLHHHRQRQQRLQQGQASSSSSSSSSSLPPSLEHELFARVLSFFGEASFPPIQQAFIVVVGLGGVGSHAAQMLVRSGVKRIRVVDFDQVKKD